MGIQRHSAKKWASLNCLLFMLVSLFGIACTAAQRPAKPGPLFAALAGHNYSRFEKLLENGSDPNETSAAGFTVLMDASFRGDDKAALMLLRHKAAVNGRADDGATALLTACQWNHLKTVNLLIQHKANPNLAANGLTPLMSTLARRPIYLDILECLVRHGADVNLGTHGVNNPLMMAASGSGTPAVKAVRLLLLRGAKVNTVGHGGYTAIFGAASSGNMDVARALLRAGARTDIRDAAGQTAVDFAIHYGHPDMALLLRTWRRRGPVRRGQALRLPRH